MDKRNKARVIIDNEGRFAVEVSRGGSEIWETVATYENEADAQGRADRVVRAGEVTWRAGE